jgi:phenylacetaldehyde dehydrogenase
MRKYQLLIAGHWVDAASGKTFEDINPATGEVLANVCEADTEDINRAVAAAHKAFEDGPWGRMPGSERGKIRINGALFAAFIGQGQTCVQGGRLFLHEAIHDAFLERFLTRANRIRVGDPLLTSTQMGPQISGGQLDKIHQYVQIGKSEGARLAMGGHIPEDPALHKGFFYTPTIWTDVRNPMRIAQEEIFGPVVAVIRFADEAEAIREANAIPFGLGAAIWSGNVQRVHRVAHALRAGVIWLNDYHRIDPASPWGGFKMSGIGRENGLEAIRNYTDVKSIWVSLDERPNRWYESDGTIERLN